MQDIGNQVTENKDPGEIRKGPGEPSDCPTYCLELDSRLWQRQEQPAEG